MAVKPAQSIAEQIKALMKIPPGSEVRVGNATKASLKALQDGMRQMDEQRQEMLRTKDFSGYLCSYAGHEGLKQFLKIQPLLSHVEYWKLLADVWTGVEVIQPDQEIWLCLLTNSRRRNRECLMTPRERKILAGLPDSIEIWRGCGDAKGVRGLSWTLDRERAEFFATYAIGGRRQHLAQVRAQHGVKPFVVRARCRKANVIAYFMERQESEIVVNPKFVRVLEKLSA